MLAEGRIVVVESRPNIWQLQSRGDARQLIHALRYPDPEVRGRAAVALRTLDATQAIPALKEALRNETDEQVGRHLAAALRVLDHRTDVEGLIRDQNVDGLIEALKSQRPDMVIAAARALGASGNRTAVEPLVILFHGSSAPPAVRLAAAEALLELKSAPAVVTLLGALRRDSWQVRRNAAAVLGQIQATWAVTPLADALDDAHPVVRRTAAAALQRIGTSEAIAVLRARFAPQPAPPPPSEPAVEQEPARPDIVPAARAQQKPLSPQPASSIGVPAPTSDAPKVAPAERVRELDELYASEDIEAQVFRVAHDTRPSEARRAATSDTVPITPARQRPTPPPQKPASPPSAQPVHRLIAFLKRRAK
jgi:HEAT repeat protein